MFFCKNISNIYFKTIQKDSLTLHLKGMFFLLVFRHIILHTCKINSLIKCHTIWPQMKSLILISLNQKHRDPFSQPLYQTRFALLSTKGLPFSPSQRHMGLFSPDHTQRWRRLSCPNQKHMGPLSYSNQKHLGHLSCSLPGRISGLLVQTWEQQLIDII